MLQCFAMIGICVNTTRDRAVSDRSVLKFSAARGKISAAIVMVVNFADVSADLERGLRPLLS